MDNNDLLEFLPAVLVAARSAGRVILEVYRGEFGVTTKSDRSPLTEADLRAHAVLHAALTALGPGWPVLSEEEQAPGWDERRQWSRYWLIDPLDGTREFVKRNGQFTVNVALVEGHRPRLGVIHAPALSETFFGIPGIGAFASRNDDPWERLRGARSHAEEDGLRVLASRSHDDERLEGWLSDLGPHRRIGLGSSLKFCRLAAGEADLYVRLGPTSEWDTGAGQGILEAAGGWVCDLAGRPLAYNTRAELKNPFFVAGRSGEEAELLRPHLRCGDGSVNDGRGGDV
jgi:3'(2'), 5'-bisphosphate nucleotidase